MLHRSAVKVRALALVKALESSKGTQKKILLKEVNDLIKHYPSSIGILKGMTRNFIRLTSDPDETLRAKARQTLALIGYTEPPRAPGIRILSIDGGGTRGLVSIEILRHIERQTNRRIHELFDLICGVSSGAIITLAIGSGKFTLDQCETFYREMSEDIFKTDFWSSTPRLLWTHAYYDSTIFENTLKKSFGNSSLMSLAAELDRPKLVAVSVNARSMQPFLFRNFAHDPSIGNQFDGTCSAEVWQAVRASSAAPGYFQEFKFGSSILLDGGMLVNNCTGLAHAEANLLWPGEPIQCIVSVGSGKFKPNKVISANATSLYEKAHGLLYSATDTETMHLILHRIIKDYHRFNPLLSENLLISENRKLKLDQLRQDANSYMVDNELMLQQVATKLTKPRPLYKKVIDQLLKP